MPTPPDAAYQTFAEWFALNTPNIQGDLSLEQCWSAITTLRLLSSESELPGKGICAEVAFTDIALLSTQDGMVSLIQDRQQIPFRYLFALQAFVSASVPVQSFFEAKIQESATHGHHVVDTLTLQSRNGLYRIAGVIAYSDCSSLEKESLEASITSFACGSFDEYAKEHCNCFSDWMFSLESIDISDRLLLPARGATVEAKNSTMNDPLSLELSNLVLACHGTNKSLVNTMNHRRQTLEHHDKLVAAQRMAAFVSIVLPTSSNQNVQKSASLKSGRIEVNGSAQEVWSVSLDTSFPLVDLFQLDVCVAGFPVSMMKTQKERRVQVSEKGIVTIESDEGLCLVFSLLQGNAANGMNCNAKVVSSVRTVIEPWLSGTANSIKRSTHSEYSVSFKSVSFPFEIVRSKLESLGIYEL